MGLIENFISKFRRQDGELYIQREYYKEIKAEEWTIDPQDGYNLYYNHPHVQIVLEKLAKMFSNATIKLIDSNGNVVEDKEFDKFIQNPNLFQGMNSFLETVLLHYYLFGNFYAYANKVSSLQKYPATLNPLNPKNIKIDFTGKFLEQVKLDGVIKKVTYTEDGKEKTIDLQKLFWLRRTDLVDITKGTSILSALKYPVSNTELAYKYLNVLNNKKGALGMITPEVSKDTFGGSSLGPDERKEITDAYEETYGTGKNKNRTMISPMAMKWQDMGTDVGKLKLIEQNDANFLTVCDIFKVNSNCFSLKNPTYENVKNAIKLTYQDTVFPFADNFSQSFSKFLKIENSTIELDYSHIPFLQDDEKEEQETLSVKIANIEKLLQLQLITNQQAKKIIGDLLKEGV